MSDQISASDSDFEYEYQSNGESSDEDAIDFSTMTISPWTRWLDDDDIKARVAELDKFDCCPKKCLHTVNLPTGESNADTLDPTAYLSERYQCTKTSP